MTRVLVPVAVLEGGTVSHGLITLLGAVEVTVLGYHVLPEQTPPDQARLQYEDRATEALEGLTEEFQDAGAEADHRLVFTHDRDKTVDRVAEETGATAVAISGMTSDVERILVSLSGEFPVDRILSFVEDLISGRDIAVTLLFAGDEGDADPLDAANARLRDSGIETTLKSATGESPFEAMLEAVANHDVIVMGEKAPSLRSLIFGEESDRVASAAVGPVLVVRSERPPDE